MRPAWPLLLLVVLLLPRLAGAHGPAPVGVAIDEHAPGAITVQLRRPHAAAPVPAPRFTAVCIADAPPRERLVATEVVTVHTLRCAAALAGTAITIDGLVSGGADAMVRVTLHDGAVHRAVASAASPRVEVPRARAPWSVFGRHVLLGVGHLLGGADHLVFALGLVLIARAWLPAIAGLSAFTVGHSLTLVAATLGWLRVPATWAELGIAASAVVVALELTAARPRPPPRRLVVVAVAAGLLHGLGFASALASTGADALVPALAGFNLGVELGQLAAVATLAIAWGLARRLGLRDGVRPRLWIGHALGAIAMMWCFARTLVLLA